MDAKGDEIVCDIQEATSLGGHGIKDTSFEMLINIGSRSDCGE